MICANHSDEWEAMLVKYSSAFNILCKRFNSCRYCFTFHYMNTGKLTSEICFSCSFYHLCDSTDTFILIFFYSFQIFFLHIWVTCVQSKIIVVKYNEPIYSFILSFSPYLNRNSAEQTDIIINTVKYVAHFHLCEYIRANDICAN